MRKNIWKRISCFLVICCVLLGNIVTVSAAEPFEIIGNATPSDTAYSVILTNASGSFMHNEKEVDLTIGKRYYLVYTVEEVSDNQLNQNGLVITTDGNHDWPYTEGMMNYLFSDSVLFEEGATYFYRVEVTEDGFSYVIAKMGKNDSHWVELPITEGATYTDCKYFGIWMAGTMTAKLSTVLCYDEDGNDLGISVHTQAGGSSVFDPSVLKEMRVGQYYEFSLDSEYCLAISNSKPTDSDTVYMSYTVEDVQVNQASQAGVCYTRAPQDQYPHGAGNGLLNYTFCDKTVGSPLFVEGGQYLIYAKNEGDTTTVLVRRTVNGKTEIFSFPNHVGAMTPEAKWFSIWTGEAVEECITANIKNFRCYDATGKNLGVQTNKSDITITKYGDIEDYTNCEAVYWCEENQTTMILDDEQNMSLRKADADTETKWYKYRVNGAKLFMAVGSEEVSFDYYYSFVCDEEGNKYIRLIDKKVTFVTGIEGHEGNQTIKVTAEDGYKVKKPEDPKVEGYTFKEWCLADGTSYDFDRYVMESVTLYARYTDGDGHEYLSVDGNLKSQGSGALMKVAALSTGIVLLTVALMVYLMKGEKNKNERKN